MSKLRMVFLSACLLAGIQALKACDVCGGGGGGGYGSILPMFQQNMLGIRLQHSVLHHPAGMNKNGESTVISDRYRQADVWFRCRLNDRLFLTTLVPVRETMRKETAMESRIRGLGDLRSEINWVVYRNTDSLGSIWKHVVQLGAGIKLNNGRYMQRLDNGVMAPLPLQAGSGALGGLLRVQHILRRGRAGLQTDLQYAAFGGNELSYRVGSQASAGLRAFYWNYRGSRQYLFNAGLLAERIAPDQEFGAFKPESGGRFLYAQTEAVVFLGRVSVQFQAGLPLMQQLTPAQPAAGLRVGVGVAAFF